MLMVSEPEWETGVAEKGWREPQGQHHLNTRNGNIPLNPRVSQDWLWLNAQQATCKGRSCGTARPITRSAMCMEHWLWLWPSGLCTPGSSWLFQLLSPLLTVPCHVLHNCRCKSLQPCEAGMTLSSFSRKRKLRHRELMSLTKVTQLLSGRTQVQTWKSHFIIQIASCVIWASF